MKIDLHLHTKEMFKGDGKKRNINAREFKQKMIESSIGLAAITNHNHFDLEQWNNFKDDKYLLLPGIEVDFLEHNNKNKRSQLNIIFSDEESNLACEISDFLKKEEVSAKKPIPIQALLNKIKSKKVILFLDNKRGKTNVSEECTQYIKDNIQEIPLIFDSNNIRTLRLLASSNANALIGSDVRDWNKYDEDSLDLVESQWDIRNFDALFQLLKTRKPISGWLTKLDYDEFQIKIQEDVFSIETLKAGINIIIGDKATGKSEILENIRLYLRENVAYFSEDEKKQEYQNLIKESNYIFKENLQIERELKQKIKDLAEMKPSENNTPFDFFQKTLSPHMSDWNIQNSILEKKGNISFEILKGIDSRKLNLEKYIEDNIDFFDKKLSNKRKEIFKKLNFLIAELKDKFILVNIELLSSHISDNIKTKIRDILKEEKGIKTNDLNIGLWNYYNYKKNFKINMEQIKAFSLPKKDTIILDDEIPTIGKIKIIELNRIIPFNEIKKINKHNSLNHAVGELKDSLSCFLNLTHENVIKFQNYWNEKNIDKGLIYKKRKIFSNNQKEIKLSSGQQSILLLSNTLNSDKKYILLDEPSSRIGSNSIMRYVSEKIEKLRRAGKTLIITTHNSNLGINILPNMYIFRRKKNNGYETLWSHIYNDHFYDYEGNPQESFNNVVLDMLEGGEEPYNTRKEIYESKVNN